MAFINKLLKQKALAQRLVAQLSRNLNKINDEMQTAVESIINRKAIRTQEDLNELSKAVNNVLRSDVMDQAIADTLAELKDFAVLEADQLDRTFSAPLGNNEVKSLSKDAVASIVAKSQYENRTTEQWLKRYATKSKDEIMKLARFARAQGLDSRELANLMVGTEDFNYKDGLFNKRMHAAKTTARTAMNAIATKTQQDFYKQNKDVIEGEQILVTLDGRTSIICAAYSERNETFKVGEAPRPPFHPNCRSLIVPKLKEKFERRIGDSSRRAASGDKGGTQVPRNQSYDTFLRAQSAEFQREALGETKYKLFSKGVKLDKFVDNDKPISAKALAQKYKDLI